MQYRKKRFILILNFSLNSGGKMRHKIKLIAATKNLAKSTCEEKKSTRGGKVWTYEKDLISEGTDL